MLKKMILLANRLHIYSVFKHLHGPSTLQWPLNGWMLPCKALLASLQANRVQCLAQGHSSMWSELKLTAHQSLSHSLLSHWVKHILTRDVAVSLIPPSRISRRCDFSTPDFPLILQVLVLSPSQSPFALMTTTKLCRTLKRICFVSLSPPAGHPEGGASGNVRRPGVWVLAVPRRDTFSIRAHLPHQAARPEPAPVWLQPGRWVFHLELNQSPRKITLLQ